MESIKETLSNWLEGFQNYINSFTVIEKQNKIFYFSKFSLVLSEFYQIYSFVKTLKENIFRSLIEQFKYCVKNIIVFNNQKLSEKERVIILYSSCLLIYYKKFCFDTNNSFEEYFDSDFIYTSSTTFGYQIVNHDLFKIFIFYYYSEIKKEILSLDYNNIKNLKKYYSYKENNNNEIKHRNKLLNKDNKNEMPVNKNISNSISTNISINNDYFPDPNILLPKRKLIKKNYNNIPKNKIINTNNIINLKENEEENVEDNKINTNLQQENFGLQEQVLTYLTSTKERMVDLVFEIGYKGYFPIFNKDINDRLQQFHNISTQNINLENHKNEKKSNKNDFPQIPKTLNVNKNSINSINKKMNINSINSINDINQKLESNINSFFNSGIFSSNNQNKEEKMNVEQDNNNIINSYENKQNDKDISINNSFISNDISACCNFESLYNFYANNTNNNNGDNNNSNNKNNNNKYTKTIISELSKYEVDDKIVKIIEEVAKNIDSNHLDKVLNNSSKQVRVINYFSCYMVEFTPEMLQSIEPKYKDILQNFCIKFIVLAKELYNTAMELFTTIYDLSFTNIDTFINLSRNCGIQIQYAESLYNMFKDYSTLLLEEKESKSNIKNILKKLFKQQKILWDKSIKQKANEFTTFYKVQNI